MSPFLRAVLEYLLPPEGTHNALMIPPFVKVSEKILKLDSKKTLDTYVSTKKPSSNK